MRREDDYPGEWSDRRAAEERSDALATIIIMGWWLIPLGVGVFLEWVSSLF